MPKLAANISMLFTEWDFLDRFAAAAAAGFRRVECQFPYAHDPDAIAARLARTGLELVLFNAPPGDIAAGERGLAGVPERLDAFRESIATVRRYAAATGTRRVHVMAGMGRRQDPAAWAAYRRALAWAADAVAADGLTLLIEPINRRDVPGYLLDDFDAAEALLAELARPNLKLQFDLYHRQILHGDVTMALRRLLPAIGHVQVAGVPARQEPDAGELNLPFLFAELDRLGYDGVVGCEYHPRAGTLAGLGWFAPWRET